MGNKLTIEFVRESFKKEGWVCFSEKYIGSKANLDYVCPKGHKGTITWGAWQQGRRCPVCSRIKRHTIEFVESEFKKEGWMCLSKEYINSYSKLEYICPEGHHGSITWDNWRQGNRCPVCAGLKKLTIEFIRAEFERKDWILTSTEYVNTRTKLNYICPKGHRGSIRWGDWKQGGGCPKCKKTGISIWEATVKQFVGTINTNFLENDRTIILNPDTNRYVELDLWFPNLNKAIECNSKYWHNKRKHIDDLKQEWCKNNNVSLLSIDFDEWNKDIKKCQKKIEKFLN